jgi:glutathione synthase
MTLTDLVQSARLDKEKSLFIRTGLSKDQYADVKVSVAYFRSGYTPNDYPTEDEWAVREMIEISSAIKCPTVGYQLAGTKKIQQVLCERGTNRTGHKKVHDYYTTRGGYP